MSAPAPRHACPLDLVNRHFGAHDLNELWVADTYVPTQAGWVYVSFVTDVCSRKILGWKVASSLHADVALDALNMAIYQRRRDGIDARGVVHHSDRGVQYRDVRYGQALARCQAVASVGSTGDSYDNALAEALNSLYKAELIDNEARPGYAPVARSARGRARNRRLGPLVQHPPPPPRPGRHHTTTSRKPTHNNTKGSGLNKPPQNPGLDTVVSITQAASPTTT